MPASQSGIPIIPGNVGRERNYKFSLGYTASVSKVRLSLMVRLVNYLLPLPPHIHNTVCYDP